MTAAGFQVRRAVAGDELRLIDVRLRALTDDPYAFGSTLTDERARVPEAWARWISPGATFLVLGAEGEPAQGIVAGYRDADDPTVVHLVSMWVAPALRGSGAAAALIEALMTWARDEKAREVHLHVVHDNARAIRAYERAGFTRTDRTFVRERDGAVELEMARSVPS